jgi:hypothetical protein
LWSRATAPGSTQCGARWQAELSDAETAWIFQAALRQWPGIEHDAAWQQNFSAMIEKARPHGWIDDQRNAIKAHIEWV